MLHFINDLKLVVKLNITTAIAAVTVIIATIMFFVITNIFFNISSQNSLSKERLQETSNRIINLLHKIDYSTINHAINQTNTYEEVSQQLYKELSINIDKVAQSDYLHNDAEAKVIIKNIKIRIHGYKSIADSLQEEVQEDSTDGLYAIMGLSAASQRIMSDLEELNNKINIITKKNIQELNQNIFYIKIFSVSFISILFMLMLYTNKIISISILERMEQLKEGIMSFFDMLSKKRENVIHVKQDGKDEIAEIAHIVDSNIYIAEDILKLERMSADLIEKKVDEATKELQALNNEVEATQREVVFTMGSIAEERSKETGNHVKRVAEYSLILARLYGMSLEESLLIKNASPMHDIGKVAIPDDILNKPGRFTPEEFEIMKAHAELGHKMLKFSERSILKAASILAYEHHERWDGKGYPRGLKGEEIHIYGRITAIADVFDALGSDRVYKEAWPLKKILNLFEEERGKQFDPDLVDLFLDHLEHFLAAKEIIENGDKEDISLSTYIEDFNKVEKYIVL